MLSRVLWMAMAFTQVDSFDLRQQQTPSRGRNVACRYRNDRDENGGIEDDGDDGIARRIDADANVKASKDAMPWSVPLRVDTTPFLERKDTILGCLDALHQQPQQQSQQQQSGKGANPLQPPHITSTSHWIQRDLLTSSTAEIVNTLASELLHPHHKDASPQFFTTEPECAKFDFEWRYAYLRSMSNNPELAWTLRSGQSNTHPLRFQLKHIPAHTVLPLQIHAALEFNVVLLGQLHVREPSWNVMWDDGGSIQEGNEYVPNIDDNVFQRLPQHTWGSALNTFEELPTADEMRTIRQYLSQNVVEILTDASDNSAGTQSDAKEGQQRVVDRFFRNLEWEECEPCMSSGDCRMHAVGSISQSYTGDESCLILTFGSDIHASFGETRTTTYV